LFLQKLFAKKMDETKPASGAKKRYSDKENN